MKDITAVLRSSNGSTATVDIVSLETQGASTGCRDWSGSYTLQNAGGHWLIDYANLRFMTC
jgi:hypothetical protein